MKHWEQTIRKVEPYIPGEQPNLPNIIKLNTNENPYPPAPELEQILKEFPIEALRLYPDPSISCLVEQLANYCGLKSDQIFVGVGSDDVLAMAFLTFFNSGKPILFPDITYSFYPVWANLFRIPFKTQRLNDNFTIRKEDYYKENGGIVLANPNAPTSIYEKLEFIQDILEHNENSIVIIDEAYIDFGGISAKALINQYDNLLVVQTYSKSRSMAGARIGYAMGNHILIQALNNIKYSYNSYTINVISLQLGIEAIKNKGYFKETVDKIIETRIWTEKQLRRLKFSFPESKANFIFATHEKVCAKQLYESLREQHIFVRYFNLPRIDNYLRITIGTREQMEQFIEYLEQYLYPYLT